MLAGLCVNDQSRYSDFAIEQETLANHPIHVFGQASLSSVPCVAAAGTSVLTISKVQSGQNNSLGIGSGFL